MEQSEPDPRIGQMIGNYVVRSRLGKGGMGSVYVGEHPEIKRQVAIKVLHPSLAQQPDFSERFIDEARIIAQLDHPNVVDIYDFGRMGDGSLYYVMEVLHGVDLADVLIESIQLSPVEVLPYLVQICSALDAAHEAGVVHRDLKLENIYVLDRDPLLVKLLDFGISKMLNMQEPAHSKTATGVVIGTPTFMAPEQVAGRPELIGPQTDLYAVGVVLFHLLTGRAPFAADTAPELMVKHMNEPPPSLRSINPDLPLALDELLKTCLAKNSKQRPPSAGWIAQAYAEALDLDQVAATASIPVRRSTTARTRRGPAPASPVSTSTLSGSAAQMSAITVPRSPVWRRMALVVSVLAVGLTVFFVLRYLGERDAEPRTAAKQKTIATTPEPRARSDQRVPIKPAPAPAAKSSTPSDVRIVTVESDEPGVQCRYSVSRGGDMLLTSAPCRIEVPLGEELYLEVRREGHSPWDGRWQVKADRKIRARTLVEEKRITIVDLEGAPAQDAGSPPAVAASPDAPEHALTRADRRRLRRAARRRRARKARQARAKKGEKKAAEPGAGETDEPAAAPPKSAKKPATKKAPKRVGAGTLDF